MSAIAPVAGAASMQAGKFLSFHLGAEEFAVPVQRVREIIPWQDITGVPQAASYVLGIINLRGTVVPVMDLRRRLGMAAGERDQRACIVVMQPDGAPAHGSVGVAVDGVDEVLSIQAGEMEDMSSFAGSWMPIGFVHGIAKTRTGVKLLLELGAVLGGNGEPGEMAGRG